MVTRHPRPPYRYRVVAHGGRADGTVVDCKTLEWAMRWYRILLRVSLGEEERRGEERQAEGLEADPGR